MSCGKKRLFAVLCGAIVAAVCSAMAEDTVPEVTQGYRIEQPGTITFTVGVKISGKVEKPQVMIFLPKEKTLYREETFSRSFKQEIAEPLPFSLID